MGVIDPMPTFWATPLLATIAAKIRMPINFIFILL
jgi:hypothetical protein